MPNRNVIVIGASAGGIEALEQVLAGLPPDLPAAVLVVLHMPATGGPSLARILARAGALEVVIAEDGMPLEAGRIYVSTGDRHLLVGKGHLHVRKGPRENGHRPAVDPMFRSAAAYYGPRVVAVVLSGALSDGTAGLLSVRSRGGVVVVQDPEDALYKGMPSSAIEYAGADHVVRARDIGPLLGRLAGEDIEPEDPPVPIDMQEEIDLAEGATVPAADEHPGTPSPWPCPDCSGVLWEIQDGPLLRFRCRVGHAWAAEALLHQQGDSVETALWMALRALEDRAALGHRLAERAEQGGWPVGAVRYREDLGAMDRSITTLKRLLSAEPAEEPDPDRPADDPATRG